MGKSETLKEKRGKTETAAAVLSGLPEGVGIDILPLFRPENRLKCLVGNT
jgi:hypothetical protein